MTRAVCLTLAAVLLPASLPAQAPPAALTAMTRQVFVAESSFAATMALRDSVGFARFIAPDAPGQLELDLTLESDTIVATNRYRSEIVRLDT